MAEVVHQFKYWLRTQFMMRHLNTPMGFALLICLGCLLAYTISMGGIKVGGLLLIIIIGIPAIGACIFNPLIGICVSLVLGVLIGLLSKYADVPFGLLLDFLLFVLFFGLLIRQVKERDLTFAKNPVSAIILIWVFYNIIQVINPTAASRLAWVYTVRTMAGLILLYFIASEALNSLAKVKFIVKFIIGISLLSALYGLKQEFIGFTAQEMAWLTADEERYQLINQWSRLRIFSFFSDPTTYGIYMAYMGTFCTVLATGPYSMIKRGLLIFSAICMFMGMAYAGSRTPFVLVPFGFLVFIVLNAKKEILIGAAFVALLGAGFVLKSTSNAVVYRIQSAFMMDKSDDTMQVRYKNQLYIRPFIYSHPFGAGLGSTGIWGKRFTPDSELAKFPHDSGFVRVAVELGWFGLIIFGAFLFIIIRFATFYYFRVEDPKIKNLYLGIIVIIFMLTLASYPQEAIPILPTSIIFYTLLGAMVRLKDFDSTKELVKT